MDENKAIHDSFERIVPKEGKKTAVYYEILRNYEKKGYVSNRKLHFFKQKFDRMVPALALCLVGIFVFAYFGVTSGLLTGSPFQTTDQLLNEAGYGQAAGAGSAADEAEMFQAPEAAKAEAQEDAGETTEMTRSGAAPALVTANIYAALDVGYTRYIVSNMPQDALLLWEEMEELEAVPAAINLEAYSLDAGALTLEFSADLQEILDKSAADSLATAIAATYRDFYPEAEELVILSGGSPITFQGEAIDLSAATADTLSVTDTRELEYGA